MEEKVIRKLKFYDKVVEVGRKKYSQDYIDYASGYLSVFDSIIISDRLGLKHTSIRLLYNISWRSGFDKGYADLMTWRGEDKNKERQRS